MATHNKGIGNSNSSIVHMDKTFASFGDGHQRFAIAGEKQCARTGLGIVRPHHEAWIDYDDVPVRMLAGSGKQDFLALFFAATIVGTGEWKLHGGFLIGRMGLSAVADGIGSAGVNQAGDACLRHKLHQPLA